MNFISNETIHDYTQIVSEHLDKIPTKNLKFALEIFLKSYEPLTEKIFLRAYQIPYADKEIMDRVHTIKHIVDIPEFYSSPEVQERFKELVLAKVAAKIKEINLSFEKPEIERARSNMLRDYPQISEVLEMIPRVLRAAALLGITNPQEPFPMQGQSLGGIAVQRNLVPLTIPGHSLPSYQLSPNGTFEGSLQGFDMAAVRQSLANFLRHTENNDWNVD